ncbi:cupredoxin domain-containing protein [Duganella aceris]|nr:cupredoxin domain-containing protein [Duganella aceris]
MMSSRRRLLLAAPLLLASSAMLAKAPKRRVIRIEARKFRFAPNVIELKAGEEVVLELTAIDFVHGFSLPDFNLRVDLVMGKPVRVTLKPEREGRFGFLCDNFCGSGHEEMAGTIVVKA